MQFEEESRTALYIYMLRSLAAFSVLQRRSTCVSAEFPEKISHVIISATVLQHHMFACSLKAFYLAADRLFLFLKLIIFR